MFYLGRGMNMETLNQEQVLEEVLVDEWYDTEKEKPVYFFVKRVIDIVLSLCGLINRNFNKKG